MNISEFSFHLVLIFLPGIIAFLIIDNLSSHKPYKNVYIFMYVLLLGMMSYITLSILNNIITFFAPCISGLHIWENMTQPGGNLSLTEIFFAAIISVFLGCLISLINKHALFMRFSLKLHLTRRHGFPDTFSYMMHLYSNAIKNYPFYLTITDWERKFRIVGQLVAISEPGDLKEEVLLQDCTVYNLESGEELYSVPVFYFSPVSSNISVELYNS